MTFHSTPDKLTFKSFEKFKTYLIFEGLEPILEQYEKQLSQQSEFREDYVRCAKTLMQVGDDVSGGRSSDRHAAGADRRSKIPLASPKWPKLERAITERWQAIGGRSYPHPHQN